jgi:ligand-binding SRPBCC domain-containing protein
VFAFFADARNLEAITPPWLHFHVQTHGPIEMEAGTLIAYRMRLHGVPVRWLTRIESWEPDLRFVDLQLSGPYALWHHEHTFTEHRDGTLMHDAVTYALPLGSLGELARRAFVGRDLERIFDFRAQTVARMLDRAQAPS